MCQLALSVFSLLLADLLYCRPEVGSKFAAVVCLCFGKFSSRKADRKLLSILLCAIADLTGRPLVTRAEHSPAAPHIHAAVRA